MNLGVLTILCFPFARCFSNLKPTEVSCARRLHRSTDSPLLETPDLRMLNRDQSPLMLRMSFDDEIGAR